MLGYDSIFKSLVPSILDQKIRLFVSDILLSGIVVFLKYKNNPPKKEDIDYIFSELFVEFEKSLKSSDVYEEYLMASLISTTPDYNFLSSDIKTTLLRSEESLKDVFNRVLGDLFKVQAQKDQSFQNYNFSIILDTQNNLSSDQIIPKISIFSFFQKILENYKKQIISDGVPYKNENEKLDKMLLKLINFDEET